MSSFRKRVSTIEKLYLSLNRLRPPFVNQLVVQGVGRISANAMAAAIDRATEVNPGATLRRRGSLGWMRWEQGPAPQLTVVAAPGWSGRDGRGAPFLERPLGARHGPSCEVQYVDAGDTTYLIFRSLHATMDGAGTRAWVEDVFRELRGESAIGHGCTMTDTEFAAGLTQETKTPPPPDALHPCGVVDSPSSGEGPQWYRVTVEPAHDDRTLARLAVTLAAEARRHAEGVVRFNVPADLRFFHPEERSTGNAIGAIYLEVPPGTTVEALANDIRERLRAREHARFPANYQRLRWLPLAAINAACRHAFAREHVSGRYPFSATLSFIGTMSPQALSAGQFRARSAFWLPPVADQNCFVTVTRWGQRLELVVGMPDVFCVGEQLGDLAHRLGEALGSSVVRAANDLSS